MSVFDFEHAEAWEPRTTSLLPDGDYVLTVQEADNGTTSNGNPQIIVRLASAEGEIRDWLVITQANIGKVVAIYDAAKVQRPQADEFDAETGRISEPAILRLVGQKVGTIVRSETDVWEGRPRTRTRVQGYLPAEKLSDAPIDSAGLPLAGTQAQAAPTQTQMPVPTPDDKIPF